MNAAASTSSNPVTQAVNAFTNVANNAVKAANTVANQAVTTVSQAATQVATAANKAVNTATSSVTSAMNTVAKNTAPAISSLIPFGNASGKKNGNLFGSPAAATPPPTASNFSVTPIGPNSGSGAAAWWAWPLGIFVLLVTIFVVIFAVYSNEIKQGYETVASYVKKALGLSTAPDVQAGTGAVTEQAENPQDETPDQANQRQNIVEKILPTGSGNEVFNVSQNKFTFYDAEPLCRALGAELATYEQVKDAWAKGADWCNYGWVKGQMAVYPTQKETYDKLQAGPEEERAVCGTVGINGGFFDNPELRYGVNCYGKKPSQSAHDEKKLMEEGKIPRSPAALTVDKLINEFKSQRDSLFVRPFNDGRWSTN